MRRCAQEPCSVSVMTAYILGKAGGLLPAPPGSNAWKWAAAACCWVDVNVNVVYERR